MAQTKDKIITKGTMLDVHHCRKGKFIGFATRDFDPNKEMFYPVAAGNKRVRGMVEDWEVGEDVPCRKSLCSIRVIKTSNSG